jgi:AraC-like DNA-binding protein
MFIGPSIYYYVRLLLGYTDSFSGLKTWSHSVPALPAIIYTIYFASLPTSIRIEWLISDYKNVRWEEYLINILFYIQLIIYITLCLRMVNRQLKKSRFIEFGGKLIDIFWLRYFFGIALTLFLLKTIICIWENSDQLNTLIGIIFMDILFLYFFINSIWKTGVFTQNYIEPPKNQASGLKITEDIADAHIEMLLNVIKTDKVYLSVDCNIEDLADRCHIPKHHLSHILNTHLNKSFTDFINEYRVQHACQLIQNNKMKHLTIEALGTECGFGSKPSFNRAFKKHTGYTPSEYKQLHIK